MEKVMYKILIFLLLSEVHGDSQELKLLNHLFGSGKYNPSVRPVNNFSDPLIVTFGLSLHHIIDVDEKNQILTTSCWLTQIWNDSNLTWNEADYGGIRVIRLPLDKLWKPDLILYNNADSQYTSSVINTNLILTNQGEVTWLSNGIYKSSCDINTEYFPFDLQNCTMKWGSWTFDGYQLDLRVDGEEGDISNYHNNGEFDLIQLRAVRNVQIYSCCPDEKIISNEYMPIEPYPDILYTIIMKRRPLFYVFNLIIPCFLINGMALLVFFVPSESGEKVTLGISALLSMTVFLMTIRESLPPTENTPLISLYYGVCIFIVTFASAFAVVTSNIHHRGFRGVLVPNWLRFITLKVLAKVLLVQTGHESLTEESKDELRDTFQELREQLNGLHPTLGNRLDGESVRKFDNSDSSRRSPRYEPIFGVCQQQTTRSTPITTNALIQQHQHQHQHQQQQNIYATSISGEMAEMELRFNRIATKICESLEKCEQNKNFQNKLDLNQIEWKKIAYVVDRLLFWIFLLITVTASSAILLSSPYTFN